MADNAAPHGYEEDGVTPKTPFGLNLDGTPRKSNRGARPGQRGNGGSRNKTSRPKTTINLSDNQKKEQLLSLVDMFFVTPLASLSQSAVMIKRIGPVQADALAGDAVIVNHYAPPAIDATIILAQTKPGILAWMDKVADNAPYLMLAQVGAGLAKALVENHMRPNPQLAVAGRTMVQMRLQEMAEAIQREAEAAGVTVPDPAEAAA